jgi:hypothetical protein
MVWLPALGTLYFALAAIWGLPHAQEVVGSITAFDTFLGVGLHLSSYSYKSNASTDGQLVVDKSDPAKDVYSLELTTPPEKMATQSSITLKVAPKS